MLLLLAFGAPVPEILNCPGIKLNGVMNATEFLTKAKTALANGTPQPEFRELQYQCWFWAGATLRLT